MRKLKIIDIKTFSQGHITNKRQNQNSNSGLWESKDLLCQNKVAHSVSKNM